MNQFRRGEWRIGQRLAEDITRCLSPEEKIIDFDAYSSDDANLIVKANKFGTIEEDSNRHVWPQSKNVFFHPEYGRSELPKNAHAFLSNFRMNRFNRAILLVPNSTDSMWFADLISVSQNICLMNQRGRHSIFYTRPNEISKYTRGWVILSVGISSDLFKECFDWYGTCGSLK